MRITHPEVALEHIMSNIAKTVLPYVSEHERSIVAAAIADGLGYGGIKYVAEHFSMPRNAISKAMLEMKARRADATPKRIKQPKPKATMASNA